ncbi:hypothetical protein D3C72_1715060 [compost metagenome]
MERIVAQHLLVPYGKIRLAAEVLPYGLGVGPVRTPVLGHRRRTGFFIHAEHLRRLQQRSAPAGNDRRIQHHHAAHPFGPAQRRHHRQETAQRMAHQPDRLAVLAPHFLEQLFHQVRPAARHRKLRPMAVTVHRPELELAVQFAKQLAVRRHREAVGM